jgi:hypothetical protein
MNNPKKNIHFLLVTAIILVFTCILTGCTENGTEEEDVRDAPNAIATTAFILPNRTVTVSADGVDIQFSPNPPGAIGSSWIPIGEFCNPSDAERAIAQIQQELYRNQCYQIRYQSVGSDGCVAFFHRACL